MFDLARDLNSYLAAGNITGERAAVLAKGRDLFLSLGEVLGLTGVDEGGQDRVMVDGLVRLVAELRQEARARKDYATADRVRDRLAELGIVLEDTSAGPRWRYN